MLLPSVFTFRAGPVLRLDFLSHFSHVCSGKKIEDWLANICEINMRECHTDLLCDQPIFVTQSSRARGVLRTRRCAWLSKFFRAEDHRSGLAGLEELSSFCANSSSCANLSNVNLRPII